VNLIGEHTDYNDGLSLPFAATQGVTVEVALLSSRRVRVIAHDFGEEDEFDLAEATRADGWRAYVRGAVGELQRAGAGLPGMALAISGDVPQGGGLSSSAALEVALVLGMSAVADPAPSLDKLELAKLCSRVENEWVGAQTGLLDQIASLFGQLDKAMRIDFRSLEVDPVELRLDGYQLSVLDSGEQHSLAVSGYNERRRQCSEARRRLGLESLRDATKEMAAELASPLRERVLHVVTENARVQATIAALREGDIEAVGPLLDASHASLRDCYEVSTAAVEQTVERCKQAGAVGARIMGGGFGGSVLALFSPGVEMPPDAIPVSPGRGARLI
jgi:galactokinase